MLTKPSKATNLLDLQEELAKDTVNSSSFNEDAEMHAINSTGNSFESK
jgi:hypothetical protein